MKSILAVIIIIFFQACNMFEKDETLLAEHKKSNGKRIEIYYVGLGATTSDVIQVRMEKQEKPLWVSDEYNYLKNSTLINDTSLQMILSYTDYHNEKDKLDTFIVSVK